MERLDCVKKVLGTPVPSYEYKKWKYVNMVDAMGRTALVILAAHWGSVEAAKILVENGADPNIADNFGILPLSLAAIRKDADLVDYLLSIGADINPQEKNKWAVPPLLAAVVRGNDKVLDILLKNGADLNFQSPGVRGGGNLYYVYGYPQLSVSFPSLEEGGLTAFHLAVKSRLQAIEDFLFQAGADVTVSNFVGVSPFESKILSGPVKSCEMLSKFSNSSRVLLSSQWDGPKNSSILQAAIKDVQSGNSFEHFYQKKIQCLIESSPNLDHRDAFGKTALTTAIGHRCLRSVAYEILRAGANPTVLDNLRRSPFNYAARLQAIIAR